MAQSVIEERNVRRHYFFVLSVSVTVFLSLMTEYSYLSETASATDTTETEWSTSSGIPYHVSVAAAQPPIPRLQSGHKTDACIQAAKLTHKRSIYISRSKKSYCKRPIR